MQSKQDGINTVDRWKMVPDGNNWYEASILGKMKSITRLVPHKRFGTYLCKGRELKTVATEEGYQRVAYYGANGRRGVCIHIVILETFVGPCPEGMECRHLDGDPSNNRLDNLCWGTAKENAADRKRHGKGHKVTCRRGESISWSKFKESDIREIRRLFQLGIKTQGQLAKIYNVYQSYISRIIRKVVWSHVQ